MADATGLSALNQHWASWLPFLTQPLGDFFRELAMEVYDIRGERGGFVTRDTQLMLTGSLAEGLTTGNKFPDRDMMIIRHGPVMVKHIEGKPGYAWVAFFDSTSTVIGGEAGRQKTSYMNVTEIWRSAGVLDMLSDVVYKDFEGVYIDPPRSGVAYTMNQALSDGTKSMYREEDLVMSVECLGWPALCREWKSRERLWPPQEVVNRITSSGYHLVPRAAPSGDPDVEWRLSFSRAEVILANAMSPVQKNCYRIIKSIFNIELKGMQCFHTYYLKTSFLWLLERTPTTDWEEDNMAMCVNSILDSLYVAMREKRLPNYFLPDMNLLAGTSDEELSSVADTIHGIKTNLISHPKQSPIEYMLSGLPFKISDVDEQHIPLSISKTTFIQILTLFVRQLYAILVNDSVIYLPETKALSDECRAVIAIVNPLLGYWEKLLMTYNIMSLPSLRDRTRDTRKLLQNMSSWEEFDLTLHWAGDKLSNRDFMQKMAACASGFFSEFGEDM